MHMIHWPLTEKPRCSECGCDRTETVEQGSVRFVRCLGCGHEGVRYQIAYTPRGGGKTDWLKKCKDAAEREQTF